MRSPTHMVMTTIMMVGFSPNEKLASRSNISSMLKVLNVSAVRSSAANSEAEVGTEIKPPNCVRCVVEQ